MTKNFEKIFHYKRKPEDFDDKLKTLSDGQLYDMQSLVVVFGPFSVGEWQYALNKINIHDRAYLLRMEKMKRTYRKHLALDCRQYMVQKVENVIKCFLLPI